MRLNDRELLAKLELYFSLKTFCSQIARKCWGKRDCDDCSIGKRIIELEEEILLKV